MKRAGFIFLSFIILVMLAGCRKASHPDSTVVETGHSDIAVSKTSYSDITIFETTGQTTAQRDEKTLTLVKDMKVKSGDLLSADTKSFIRACCDDDIFVYMEEQTKAKVESNGKHKISLDMVEGELVVEVQKKFEDTEINIVTPNTNMGIRGTVVAIRVIKREDGTTETYNCVLEGEAVITTPKGEQTLKAGEGWLTVTDEDGQSEKEEPCGLDKLRLQGVDTANLKGPDGGEVILPKTCWTPGIYSEDGALLYTWEELAEHAIETSEKYNMGYEIGVSGSGLAQYAPEDRNDENRIHTLAYAHIADLPDNDGLPLTPAVVFLYESGARNLTVVLPPHHSASFGEGANFIKEIVFTSTDYVFLDIVGIVNLQKITCRAPMQIIVASLGCCFGISEDILDMLKDKNNWYNCDEKDLEDCINYYHKSCTIYGIDYTQGNYDFECTLKFDYPDD